MTKTFFFLIGVVALALVGLWGFTREKKTPSPLQTDQRAPAERPLPELTLEDFSGEEVRLADFKGNPLVVNAWAAWCPFCVKELADFALAQREFGERVVIIAVDRAEPAETAKRFVEGLGVAKGLRFLLDPEDAFYRAIGGFSMPETVFVDREGVIRIHKRGPMEINEIRDKIRSIL